MTDLNIPPDLDAPKTREYQKRYAHIATTTLADRGVAGAVSHGRAAIAELLGLLAERDRMLRVAWCMYNGMNPYHFDTQDEFTADLRASAKEGSTP